MKNTILLLLLLLGATATFAQPIVKMTEKPKTVVAKPKTVVKTKVVYVDKPAKKENQNNAKSLPTKEQTIQYLRTKVKEISNTDIKYKYKGTLKTSEIITFNENEGLIEYYDHDKLKFNPKYITYIVNSSEVASDSPLGVLEIHFSGNMEKIDFPYINDPENFESIKKALLHLKTYYTESDLFGK